VDREAYLYETLRKTYPNLIAMDAGAWTDYFQTASERLKTDYLVQAMRDMHFGVFNVTPFDLAFGTTYPRQLTRPAGSGQLLSANLLIRPRNEPRATSSPARLFDPYTILEVPRKDGGRPIRIGIIGVTDGAAIDSKVMERLKTLCPKMPDCQILSTTEALATYVPEVRSQSDYVVVLAMMDRSRVLQAPMEIRGVDLYVTTFNNQSLRQPMAAGGRTIVNTGYWGRSFSQFVVEFNDENRPIHTSGTLVDIWADGPAATSFTRLLDQYHEDTKKLARQVAVALERSRFAGRTQCIVCHNAPYLSWTRTAHTFAYVALAEKNQHYNPDCLPCHVTAYGEPDGFVDVRQTAHLVSVQCEACHGPARAHVKALTEMSRPGPDGLPKKISRSDNYPHLAVDTSETVCRKCHNSEHDPNFNYARDLELISHKNLQGPFRRPKPQQPGVAAAAPTAPSNQQPTTSNQQPATGNR
jgi:hypothetical protein